MASGVHMCLPTFQRKLGGKSRWRQFCVCGNHRDVDTAEGGNPCTPWQQPHVKIHAQLWRARAVKLLQAIEWSGTNGRYAACPACKSVGPTHGPGCDLYLLVYEPAEIRPDSDAMAANLARAGERRQPPELQRLRRAR